MMEPLIVSAEAGVQKADKTPNDLLIIEAQNKLRLAVSQLLHPDSKDCLDLGQVKRLLKVIEALNCTTPRARDFPGLLTRADDDVIDADFGVDNRGVGMGMAYAHMGPEARIMEMVGGFVERMAAVQNPSWKEAEALDRILESPNIDEGIKMKVRARLENLFKENPDDSVHPKQLRGPDPGAGAGGEGMLPADAPAVYSRGNGAQEGPDQVRSAARGEIRRPQICPAGLDGQGQEVLDAGPQGP